MNRSDLLDQFDLTGRTAIVTGGSRGIGRAIAGGFAALGANVVIASRKGDACSAAAEEINAAGGSAVGVAAHLGHLEDGPVVVEAAVEAFGGIDIVVNNAANALAQPLGDITPEAWEKSFSTNLRGPVFLVQEALPHLRASAHPAIINMVTAGIYTGGGWMSMYLAAKSAMAFFTRSMAMELAGDNIRVNAIAPGTVATDMVRNNPDEVQQAMVDAQLIKRMADPDEMVPAAAFLASDASSFMTGQVMVLDGGMTNH
ncbi:MAG: glucose 1-dehydrogenase [Candidatus Microthrix subdominans]|jgi:NAD(P)-dependent dehydrogenase (short-subunit alcohol dehydrogenase family)|uniref:Glucose 1-dehydrogenase n=1 Tax=Candidatus Neomicrothrix subdominans TaxID=2954438 RepID=A0A936NAV8_9ACTN|nr:glucose 1-dehydrogenase [Candidatus Microthrix sp.]MBK9296590.1 glucose 1-dehydrogenase [Candidatus Microthrix subdominans]MBK6440060.1 glucose 1-dehydrogenase [Candidatus Microthrix sp.]MBK6968797.1 glucose 1-dehydrogenase [Candidatus Microthrix sp.]MBK7166975.1 glucose 1-dehydrogenase [Candidatus Microthrix sp.]MBK9558435.1 glucose 1-dehydrogenase [Candidatus Microthrix sp.]